MKRPCPALFEVYDAFGCALDGNIKRLCRYTRAGFDVNHLDPVTRSTLLHTAILGKQENTVKALLDAGADPNLRNEDGETPLVAAVRAGMRSTVWDLVHMGADVNMMSGVDRDQELSATDTESDETEEEHDDEEHEQTSPLLAATEVADDAMVRLLLQTKYIDVNQKVGVLRKTALHAAAFTGNLNVLHLLLSHGADVNAVDADGATPLCYAALENNVCAMRLLLYKGACLEGAGVWTPLHAAAIRNQVDALTFLLRRGHGVNQVDDMNFNPLTSAASAGHCVAVIKLLEAGAEPQQEFAFSWESTPARIIRSFCRKRRMCHV